MEKKIPLPPIAGQKQLRGASVLRTVRKKYAFTTMYASRMYALLASGGIEGPAHAAAAAKVMVRKKKGEKNAVKMVFSFFFLFTASEDNFFPPVRSEIYGRRRSGIFSLSLQHP